MGAAPYFSPHELIKNAVILFSRNYRPQKILRAQLQIGMEKQQFEKKTLWVVLLTLLTMVAEILFGLATKSMALLADGIHMGSHVLAIGLSWLAYVFVRKMAHSKTHYGNADKVLSLSGYSSGLILLMFAVLILFQAVERFFHPEDIVYRDAILVAVIGLLVNVASAFLLHHDHEHSDHNIRAAYLHVLADAVTSISAILGLLAAMTWDIAFIDPLVAIASAAVIIKWATGLLKESGMVLVDMKAAGGHKHHVH